MQKRLTRDVDNKMISGVCAGIAKYADIDPTIVRLGWAAVSLLLGCGFGGLILYIVCAFIIPAEE